MRCPSRNRRRSQGTHSRHDANSKRQNENESSTHAKRCIPDAEECQEVRAKSRGRSCFFSGNRKLPFFIYSFFIYWGKEKKKKRLLTFAFCSPIVRSGRGNGKRVAFSSIAFLALTNWRRPLKIPSPKRGEGSTRKRDPSTPEEIVLGLFPCVHRCAVTVKVTAARSRLRWPLRGHHS
jgi:hypothetical protein